MFRNFAVRFELNLCAEKEKTIYIRASKKTNAIRLAEEQLMKDPSVFHMLYLDCKEVKDG